MGDYLFVYGTLRQSAGHPMRRWLQRQALCLGAARTRGRLYRVSHYPGMLISRKPNEWVLGELYRMQSARALLARLDRYEECGPGFPPPTEYLRRRVRVWSRQGCVMAWTYLYNHAVCESTRIPSGDFLDR